VRSAAQVHVAARMRRRLLLPHSRQPVGSVLPCLLRAAGQLCAAQVPATKAPRPGAGRAQGLPEFPSTSSADARPMSFRRVLLNTCQEEFEGAKELRAVRPRARPWCRARRRARPRSPRSRLRSAAPRAGASRVPGAGAAGACALRAPAACMRRRRCRGARHAGAVAGPGRARPCRPRGCARGPTTSPRCPVGR